MSRFAERSELLDSLALFDRPEKERLRNFLPRGVDLDLLVEALFEPVDQPRHRLSA